MPARFTNKSEMCPLLWVAAVNRIGQLIGGRWAWPAPLYALPPVRWAEECVYRWVADNPHRLARWGVTPECERPGVDCGTVQKVHRRINF